MGLPIVGVGMLRAFGLIQNTHLAGDAERRWAMVTSTALYLGALGFALDHTPGGYVTQVLMSVVAILALVTTLINIWYRISAHAMAICGYTGLWLGLAFQPGDTVRHWFAAGICIGLSILVVWARVRLGAHTWAQVQWGAAVGLAVGASVGYFLF